MTENNPQTAGVESAVDRHRWGARLPNVVALTLLGIVTLVGLLLRIAQVDESLWLDELHTAWTISGGLADIPHRAAMGNYSPVYFLLPWATSHTIGFSEFALRLPSVVPGVLLMPLAYFAVVRWTASRSAALLAAWIVALEANFIFYAQEARPYALIQLLGLVHVIVFWSVLQAPTWRKRVALVSLAALLFYLHYTGLMIVVAEIVAYVAVWVLSRNRPGYRPLQFVTDFALVALACLPASGHLLEIAARRENWKAFIEPRPMAELATSYPFPIVLYVFVPAGVAVVVALIRRTLRMVPILGKTDWQLLVVLICWYLVPAGVAWFATSADLAPLFFRRYLMVASLAPVMVAGVVCAWGATPRIRIGIAMFVAAAIVVADWGGYHVGTVTAYRNHGKFSQRSMEDWRGVVRYVNSVEDASQHPVFVQSGLIEANGLAAGGDAALSEYCLLPVKTAIYPIDDRKRRIWPLRNGPPLTTDPDALATAVDCGGAWLIVRGQADWADRVFRYLTTALRDTRVDVDQIRKKSFSGVHVYHVELSRR